MEAVPMLIVFGVTALVGVLVTSVVLWPLGVLIALAAAPFGGCLLVLVVAVAVWLPEAAKPRWGRSRSQSQNRSIVQ
jgi:hypothetical protein